MSPRQSTSSSASLPALPSRGSLQALAVLGLAAAGWAVFLWRELVRSRAGGRPFCGFGPQLDCTAVWDAPFAAEVHRLSGVPVAGWGVAWGVVALVLPLLAWRQRNGGPRLGEFVSAIRLTAAAGVVAVCVLLAVSVSAGALCVGCLVSDALALGYAAVALWRWRPLGLPRPAAGAAIAGSLTLAALAVLLYPGSRTPRGGDHSGREAVAAALERAATTAAHETPAPAAAASVVAPASPAAAPPAGPETAPAGGAAAAPTRSAPALPAENERRLRDFLGSLDAGQRQSLSNALHLYHDSPVMPVPSARALLGKSEAPVRITTFSDAMCPHCAELHETLHTLRTKLPAGSFSLEARQFPLDGSCNWSVQARGRPARCLAAKAQVCFEGREEAALYAGLVYQRHAQLDPELVMQLASPYRPAAELQRCLDDPATQAKLDADIALAQRYGITGTPLVLINGRQAPLPVAPFLYAVVLTRGASEHPLFLALPPPDRAAHAHTH